MTTRRTRRLAAVLALSLMALIALPGMALASTNPQIAATGGMTATLPILGGGVAVTVALDPAGNISGVTVSDPSLAKTTSSNDFVKFATADGKTRVTVKAMGSKLSISARVTSLAELIGTGTWSANVFGNGVSSAQYTIGDDGSGNPTVALTTPGPLAAGVTWTAGLPKGDKHGGGGAKASAGGTFSYQGFTKTLKVTVRVDKGENGQPGGASLKITLTGRDVQLLTGSLADLAAAGTRTWSGYLCDGKTKVTVSYHVNTDGTIGFDGATGGTAVHSAGKDGGLMVHFTTTDVGLLVHLKKNSDGTYTLQVRGFSGQCGRGHHGHHGHGGHGGWGGSDGTWGDRQGGRSSGGHH